MNHCTQQSPLFGISVPSQRLRNQLRITPHQVSGISAVLNSSGSDFRFQHIRATKNRCSLSAEVNDRSAFPGRNKVEPGDRSHDVDAEVPCRFERILGSVKTIGSISLVGAPNAANATNSFRALDRTGSIQMSKSFV